MLPIEDFGEIVKIRYLKAALEHVDGINNFLKTFNRSDTYPIERLNDVILYEKEAVYVAEVCGQIVGVVILNPSTHELSLIVVDSSCRRNGIGKSLLTLAEKRASYFKIEYLKHHTIVEYLKFFVKMGYSQEGNSVLVLKSGKKKEGVRLIKRVSV